MRPIEGIYRLFSLLAVLEGCFAGDVFKETVEVLVGRETAANHSCFEGLMVGLIGVIAKDSYGILDAIAGDVLRER